MTNNKEEDEEETVKKIKIKKYSVYFSDISKIYL